MNKLENKVFIVMCSIMSVFVLGILVVFNVQNYRGELRKIEDSINANGGFIEGNLNKKPDNRRVFMDVNVYTIILDDDNILEIFNNSNNSIDAEEIEKVIKEVLKDKSSKKIGNLYFSNYSYSIRDNVMTLIDQSGNRKKVINNLVFSICLFLILEIVIMVTSKKISKWISKPVIDAFTKQKEFIADASHELKTPLAVIMASSDSLVGKKEDKKLIDNIKNESERMSNLINRLLELAKMEDGKLIDNFTNNNLSKIVNMAMLTFEPLAFEKKANIEGNVEKDIMLMSDNESIKELLSILIDNSIKHCEEGSTINVNLTKNKNDIILEVINKGEAIKEGDEERIFDRFYRASEDRNRKENRYGLGLAIAKGIVKMHNGEIKAKSKDGYTTFTVKF